MTFNGPDSKIHVADYNVDGIKLIYSTTEIFTWSETYNGDVLIPYGDEHEMHEFALDAGLGHPVHVEGLDGTDKP